MPTKETAGLAARAAAVARLPSFGAEASVGQASRVYRSPMSFTNASHAVAAFAADGTSEMAASDDSADDGDVAGEFGEAADIDDAADDSQATDHAGEGDGDGDGDGTDGHGDGHDDGDGDGDNGGDEVDGEVDHDAPV